MICHHPIEGETVSRGKYDLDNEDKRDQYQKIEKIRKEKRSVRGRVVDDWFVEEKEKLDELPPNDPKIKGLKISIGQLRARLDRLEQELGFGVKRAA